MHNNLQALRLELTAQNIDGFIIPSNDEFMNEYVPEHLNRLKFFTSFSGSNGVAIVTKDNAFFFTDGRYLLQASNQLGQSYNVLDMYAKESCNHYAELFKGVKKLGYDAMLHTKKNLDYYKKLGSEHAFDLVSVEKNLIDLLWNNKPSAILSDVYELDIKYSGASRKEKIDTIIKSIDKDVNAVFFSNLDAICWILNIRASDVEYNPFPLCYMLLNKNGEITLYIEKAAQRIKCNIENCSFFELSGVKQHLLSSGLKIQMDFNKVPAAFSSMPCASDSRDVVEMMKACKNETEQQGFRDAHFQDGIAIIETLHELFNNNTDTLSEFDVGVMLDKARSTKQNFVEPSFASIVGYKENGAIIHYRAEQAKSKKLGNDGLILIDSGGHYFNGTTDITRTIHLGTPNNDEKTMFTKVLKGHIQLATAIFPIGTTGAHLDILARNALWKDGQNYEHGTGHGVGHFLSVHEGPQRVSQSFTDATAIKESMVISNEPGFYKKGEFGIRIESLLLVVKSTFDGFLKFDTLTLAPIQKNLVNESMLTKEELMWLESYNQNVFNAYKDTLTENQINWLQSYIS